MPTLLVACHGDGRVLAVALFRRKTLKEGLVEGLLAWPPGLCTRRELEEMRSRWAVVRLLDAGAHSYREIHDLTGVSTATITRINQWLQHGTGGYRLLLDRIEKDSLS